jgi:lipoprotein-anchoring transpeptidase ErfK/SrfK
MNRAFVIALTGLAAVAAAPASAQVSRYATRPPVVLSPNLTEPWIVQLRPNYREVTEYDAQPYRQPATRGEYGAVQARPVVVNPQSDGVTVSPRAPVREIAPKFLPTVVQYSGKYGPGTIIIDTNERYLYLVQGDGMARRYGVGVGRPGFQWAGEHTVTRKAEWPDWRPPAAMLKRQPYLPTFMAGGPNNPLGARALYLGSTEYRIHGSNEPWTIGHAVSSGCIRMRNEDVTDLYERVKVGTKVIVM